MFLGVGSFIHHYYHIYTTHIHTCTHTHTHTHTHTEHSTTLNNDLQNTVQFTPSGLQKTNMMSRLLFTASKPLQKLKLLPALI